MRTASKIEFLYFLLVNIVLTQKIIWGPGIFSEKVYVRLNENGYKISIKIV